MIEVPIHDIAHCRLRAGWKVAPVSSAAKNGKQLRSNPLNELGIMEPLLLSRNNREPSLLGKVKVLHEPLKLVKPPGPYD